MTPPQLPVSKALVAMLSDATGKPYGLGEPPKTGAGPQRAPADPPFGIVYSAPGGLLIAAGMDDAYSDADWIYQLTAVSAKDDRQLTWLVDKQRAAMLARNSDGSYVNEIVVDGWRVTRRYDEDAGRDSEGAIVSYVERYVIAVTPA